MKLKTLTAAVLAFALCILFNALKAQVLIDKGVIKGNFDIQLTDTKSVLKSSEEFSLTKLGLQSNKNGPLVGDLKKDADLPDEFVTNQDKFYKNYWAKIKYYHITIHNKTTNKDYIGVIGFSYCPKRKKNEPVCQSYEININDATFDQADSGNVVSSYEYYDDTYYTTTWFIVFKKQ